MHARLHRLPGASLVVAALTLASSARAEGPTATPATATTWGARADAVTIATPERSEGALEVEPLVRSFASKLGVDVAFDPQLGGVRLRLEPGAATLDWGTLKRHLDFVDVVVEERSAQGATRASAQVHLRRNLSQRVAPPFPCHTVETLPASDEIVTCVYRVQNGCGNDIFATVRGLLVRDVNRIGNILYVRGPELLLFVDFAKNCRYYVEIARSMDVPPSTTPAGDHERAVVLQNARAESVAAAITDGIVVATAAGPNTLVLRPRGSSPEPAALDRVARLAASLDVLPPPVRSVAATDGSLALWQVATVFAVVAFLGQTWILRGVARRLGGGSVKA